MVNQPLFSIVTPCWNSAATIERTIQSVLEQSFKDYEYIIVDGGSTDGTLDIIKKYEHLFDGRMRWKSEPDKGLYDAFNKGVERSKGVYCWNVNSDDYMEPKALQKLADYIHTNNWNQYPVISGAMHFVSKKSNKVMSTLISDEKKLKKSFNKDCIGVPHPATLVPKGVYDTFGTFDTYYKIMGDTDWFHRAYSAGVCFSFVDFVITNMKDGGVSNLFVYRKSLRDRLYYLKKFYPNRWERYRRLIIWTILFYFQKTIHYFQK